MERLIYLLMFSIVALGQVLANELEHYNITTTTIMVHWYDTEADLQFSLRENNIAGATECEYRPDFNTSFCEMWLVRPKDEIDEYNHDTMGHELRHALVGDFHD